MSLLTTSPQEVVGAVGAVASATTQVAGAGTQAVLNVTGINAFLGYFDPNYLENEKTRHLTSLKSNSNFRQGFMHFYFHFLSLTSLPL